jgi:hypothetical protein
MVYSIEATPDGKKKKKIHVYGTSVPNLLREGQALGVAFAILFFFSYFSVTL